MRVEYRDHAKQRIIEREIELIRVEDQVRNFLGKLFYNRATSTYALYDVPLAVFFAVRNGVVQVITAYRCAGDKFHRPPFRRASKEEVDIR